MCAAFSRRGVARPCQLPRGGASLLGLALAFWLLVSAQTAADEREATDTRDAVPTIQGIVVSDELRPGDPGQVESESIRRSRDFDPSLYRPIPLPQPRPRDPDQPRLPAGNMVNFDLVSRIQEIVDELQMLPGIPEHGYPGSYGENGFRGEARPHDLGEPGILPKDFGGLTLVTDTTQWPFRSAVRLFIDARDTGGTLYHFSCSGSLIDPSHVITAGHCVYFHEDDDGHEFEDWAESIVVVPGFDNWYQPYGNASAVNLHSWAGWIDDEDFDHDIGIIDLDYPIAAFTGYMGLNWTEDCDYFEGGTWRHAGYPGEGGYNGLLQYTNVGTFDRCDLIGNELSFYSESFGGQSGSGALRNDTVWAVLSNGNALVTHDARITDVKYGHITNWILEDTPTSYDLMALDVNVSPTSLTSGDPLTDFDYLVHNYSTQSYSGTLSVSVRMSSNNDISTADPEIQTHSFATTIGPKSSLRVEVAPPTIPADAPTGTYYIGVILNLADANNLNNDSDGDEAAQISVTCPTQLTPAPITPVGSCVTINPTLHWNSVPGATSYQVQIGTSCGAGSTYSTSGTSISLLLLPETLYYWRVRAQNACGIWSSWATCFSFETGPELPGTVPLTWPATGEQCITTDPWLDWNSAPNAVDYEVQIWTACGSGPIYAASSSSFHATGLAPYQLYYWRVRGLNTCGNPGPWSPCRSFRTEPNVPIAPVLLWPDDYDDCIEQNPVLEWVPAAWATLYEVQFGPSCVLGPVYTSTEPQLAFSSLSTETTFQWRVRAKNACEEWGPWTACRRFTTGPPPPVAPALVSPADGIGCRGRNLTLSWDPIPDTNNYSVVVGSSCGAGTMYTSTSTSYSLTDLTPGTTYYWSVRAKDLCGTLGAWSDCFHFEVDGVAPSKPTNLSADPVPGAWTTDNTIEMHWNASTDDCKLIGYSYVWTDDPKENPDAIIEVRDPLAESPALPDGNTIRFHVRAVDGNHNTSTTAPIGPFWIDRTAPSVTLQIPNGGESWHEGETHTIAWGASDATSGVNTVQLRYSLDGGVSFPYIIADPDPTDTTYDWVIPAVDSDQCKVRVGVTDHAGNVRVDVSNAVFTIGPPGIGVPEMPTVIAYSLLANYPNPFNPRTTIRYSLPERARVRLAVYNVQGNLVRTLVDEVLDGPRWYEAVWHGKTDRGSAVASGVYFYRLTAGEFAETKRMILVR